MSALPPKTDIELAGEDVRFVSIADIREMTCVKQKDGLAAVSPKSNQVQLSGSTRALRQAGASPEGKVRLLLRRVRRDLQHFIGDLEGKYLSFSLLKSRRDVRHGIDPFVLGRSVTARTLAG
jgi:hypothetical protein